MSTTRGGAGGASWCAAPHIGHKLGLCVLSLLGCDWGGAHQIRAQAVSHDSMLYE